MQMLFERCFKIENVIYQLVLVYKTSGEISWRPRKEEYDQLRNEKIIKIKKHF